MPAAAEIHSPDRTAARGTETHTSQEKRKENPPPLLTPACHTVYDGRRGRGGRVISVINHDRKKERGHALFWEKTRINRNIRIETLLVSRARTKRRRDGLSPSSTSYAKPVADTGCQLGPRRGFFRGRGGKVAELWWPRNFLRQSFACLC